MIDPTNFRAAALKELQRRREEEQRQKKGGGILGTLKSVVNAPINVAEEAGGQALKGLDRFTRAVDETPIPGGPAAVKLARGDIKGALWFDPKKESEGVPRLGDPKRIAGETIREEVPGLPGRLLAGGAEALLDPTNLMGIGIAAKTGRGARIISELAGRGNMSTANYLKMLAGSGVGASAGGEIAGTPGALLGGLGGGWGSLSASSRLRKAREAANIEASIVGEEARNLDGQLEEVSNSLRSAKSPYRTFKTSDGKLVQEVTVEGIEEQIRGRLAGLKVNDKFSVDSRKEVVDSLQSVLDYMRETGQSKLLVGDEIDFGRRVKNSKDISEQTKRRFLDAVQAEALNTDLNAAMSRLPEFRFEEEGRGTLSSLFRQQLKNTPGSVEGQIAQVRDFDSQIAANREARTAQEQAVKEAKSVQKARFDEIIGGFPATTKTAARKVISSLIDGKDIEGAWNNLLRKYPQAREMRPELEQVFNEVRSLNEATQTQARTLNDLLASGKGVEETAKTSRKALEDQLQQEFGRAASSLRDRIVQVPGQSGRYRVQRLTVQNGKPALVLDYIKPAKKVEDILEESGTLRAEEDIEYRSKLEEVRELKSQQAALRKAGDREGASALVATIRDAEDAAKRIRQPARPISAKELPAAEKRIIVPLDDAREFIVFKPGKTGTPAALTKAGFRDPKTVTLLNRESSLKTQSKVISQNLEQLKLEKMNIESKLDERDRALIEAGMETDPAKVEAYDRLTRVNDNISRFETEADVVDADLAGIQNTILSSQQALEASVVMAQDEATQLRKLYEDSVEQQRIADEKILEALNVSPEDAAYRYLRRQSEINEVELGMLQDKFGGKRLSQAAYEQEIENLQQYSVRERASLSKPAQEALGNFANRFTRNIHDMGARNAILRQLTPLNAMERLIDPDASRTGFLGWMRRVPGGTGAKTERMESFMAARFSQEAAASQQADMNFGGVKRDSVKFIDNQLTKMAVGEDSQGAWARSVQAEKDPNVRIQMVLKNAAKSLDSKEWQAELKGVPETDRDEIYRLLSDKFEVATRNPNLYEYKKLDKGFHETLRVYGKQAGEVRALSGVKGIVRNLLKPEFREYAPDGRIQNPDGSITVLKPEERSLATDLYEIKSKAMADPKRSKLQQLTGRPASIPELESMLMPGKEWEVTLAANYLNKIGIDGLWRKLSTELKDPKAVEVLKRGQSLSRNEWKTPEYADDWPKLKGILLPEQAGGWTKPIETAASVMQRMAASTIVGDASFASVQGLIGMSVAPNQAANMIRKYWNYARSDEAFAVFMNDNYDDIIDLSNRGLGMGRGSLTGWDSPENIFQSIPGLKRAGNAMAAMDKITFDRMQLMNKLNLVKTLEADLQLMRAFGPQVSDEFVNGIPTLSRLQKEVNIYQSTPDEIRNAIVRQVNNTLGGLSKQQTLLGRNRQGVESALLFVPGFFRARGGLINSVSKAFKNPNSPEGYLAASILAREMLFRLSFAASIAAATGTLDEFKKETDSWATLDPRRSGGMLSGPLGDGGYLGLSWGNQAPKLYAQFLLGQEAGKFNLKPRDRLDSLTGFFEGRQNPVLGTIVDQIKGQDFMGRPVQTPQDRLANALGAVSPMFFSNSVSEANEMVHQGEFKPEAWAARSGLEFVGLNARSSVPYEVLNNRFQAWQAEQDPNAAPLEWRDAPSSYKELARQQGNITEAEENWLTDLGRRVNENRAQRDLIYQEWDNQNLGYDEEIKRMSMEVGEGLLSKEEFRQRYSKIQEDRADVANTMNNLLARAGVEKKDETIAGNAPELARLMAEYNAVKPQAKTNPDGSPVRQITDGGVVIDDDIDWGRYKAERDAILARYSPETRARFEETRIPEDPNVAELQDARAALDTYFDEMPKYRGLSNIEGKTLDGYKSILFAQEQNFRDQGIRVPREQLFNLIIRQMEQQGQISNLRQAQIATLAMRSALNPEFNLNLRSRGAIAFLLENPQVFEWYPWLESELPSVFRRMVATAPRDTSGILERELRGASLSQVR